MFSLLKRILGVGFGASAAPRAERLVEQDGFEEIPLGQLPRDGPIVRQLEQIRRRLRLLPAEVREWAELSRTQQRGFGIHRSQLSALEGFMNGLAKDRLSALVKGLVRAIGSEAASDQVASRYLQLLDANSGIHDLWGVYRNMFMRRTDPRFRPILDAADLVAADCYQAVVKPLRAEEARRGQAHAMPPVVHLMACLCPLAVCPDVPGHFIGVRILRAQRVPIPVVILPEDHANCAWLLSFLHHEVGHLLDLELGRPIDGRRGLRQPLHQAVQEAIQGSGVDTARKASWSAWAAEVLADCFGVLLGGPGFALALADLLNMLGPGLPADSRYPPYAVRIHLLRALVEQGCGDGWDEELAVLSSQRIIPTTEPPGALWDDVPIVAGACLNMKLRHLADRTLHDLAPGLAEHRDSFRKLVEFLRTGRDRPSPTRIPWRLVPPAAQVAVMRGPASGRNLEHIHTGALEFLDRIPRPDFMALTAESEGDLARVQLLRHLTESLTIPSWAAIDPIEKTAGT